MKSTYLVLSVGLTLPEANVPEILFGFSSEGWDISARTEISLINCWPVPKWKIFMIILGQWAPWPSKDNIKHTGLPPTPQQATQTTLRYKCILLNLPLEWTTWYWCCHTDGSKGPSIQLQDCRAAESLLRVSTPTLGEPKCRVGHHWLTVWPQPNSQSVGAQSDLALLSQFFTQARF